ncbi:ARM repeat-containing protein [Dacryopinax primogenitus]|uniref:ARM repeat-containing protein n=1 Tax=Dacryopinax primogenitus (strain DJM 731) TaxID=1858805 RepID=M5FYN9_DACPD|nr:ARM repeat-containing protein [Dacryopinax primogenitus]EJU01005.1 ARM repeat-containing protein [Dacryopinax primogenitus]
MASAEDAMKTVANALDTLYNNPDNAAKLRANAWLQDFQHTKDAWATSNALLLAPEAPIQWKLFAAQTFRAKATYDLSQLTPAERVNLRDMLLGAMGAFAGGPRPVLTQICLALAVMALQMPDWTGAVSGMIEAYGANARMVNALLDFLTVLPEVVGEAHVPISPEEANQRAAALLTGNSAQVLQLLARYIKADGVTESIQQAVFECARTWITYGEINPLSFAATPLFDFAFRALSDDALFDGAVDMICDLIHETQEVSENLPVIQRIVPLVIALQPMLTQSADDPERIKGICRIFVQAGESYRQLIVHHPETFFPIVQAIAQCSSLDDFDIVPVTFPFWYRFAGALGKLIQVPKQFMDVYEGLVHTLIRHLQYSQDPTSLSPQEVDDFREFRHEMGDTLKDCCSILGADRCLGIALEHIKVAIGKHDGWQSIEAPLFSMRSMGAEVDIHATSVVSQVLEIIPSLPQHPRVRYAALLFAGRYTEWINLRPDYIPFIMSYISEGFATSDPDVIAAASQAMSYLCKDCKTHLVSYLPQLHQFLQTRGQQMHQEDVMSIYDGVAWVLSSLPVSEAAAGLLQFSTPLIQQVAEATQRAGDYSRDELKPVADALENLESLIKVMIGFGELFPTDCLDTPGRVWPIFDAFLARYGTTFFISERITSVIRRAIQDWPVDSCRPLTAGVAARMCKCFQESGFSGYIWISGKLIDRYYAGGDAQLHATFATMFDQETRKLIEMYAENQSRPDVIQDVIDDYIHLLMHVAEQMPDSLYLSPSFPLIFQIVLAGLKISNVDLNHITLSFVLNILNNPGLINAALEPTLQPPAYVTGIRSVVETHAPQLLESLLTGMMDHYVEDCIDLVMDVVHVMAKLWQHQLLTWLQPTLSQIPDNLVLPEAKIAFFQDMTQALGPSSIDKVKQAVLNLHRASRRLRQRRMHMIDMARDR